MDTHTSSTEGSAAEMWPQVLGEENGPVKYLEQGTTTSPGFWTKRTFVGLARFDWASQPHSCFSAVWTFAWFCGSTPLLPKSYCKLTFFKKWHLNVDGIWFYEGEWKFFLLKVCCEFLDVTEILETSGVPHTQAMSGGLRLQKETAQAQLAQRRRQAWEWAGGGGWPRVHVLLSLIPCVPSIFCVD